MKKTCVVLSVCFFSLFCLLSCGLEAFYYIDYIPNGDMQDTTRATIRLPSSSDDGYSTYFTHFIIFYRIYISDVPTEALIASPDTNNVFIDTLNSSLNSDYSSLYSRTNKTTTDVVTSDLVNAFYNKKYFTLTFEGKDINKILSTDSLGKKMEIFFSPVNGERPKLILNETNEYILTRATDTPEGVPSLTFNPKPDKNLYFLNYPELYDTANATSAINADVATNTKTNTEFRHTYVSMYIAAAGKSLEALPRNIYSQPTFVGVFRLAGSS